MDDTDDERGIAALDFPNTAVGACTAAADPSSVLEAIYSELSVSPGVEH